MTRSEAPTGVGHAPGTSATESPWRRLLILALAVLALVLIASADSLHAMMLSLTDRAMPLMQSHSAWGAVVFVLLSALSAMLAFFECGDGARGGAGVGDLGHDRPLVAGVDRGRYPSLHARAYRGRPLVARLVKTTLLDRYETRLSDHAPLGLVILFQLGLPSELPGYLLGLVRYSPFRYLLALGIAELPWAVVTVLLGTSLIERRVPVLIALGGVAAMLSGLAFVALHRRLRAADGVRAGRAT